MSKTYDELKRAEYARRCANVVGADIRIKGDVSAGEEDLLVEGVVEGLIQLGNGILTVAATGRVIADVMAREVVVFGEVQGNLSARDRIEIKNRGIILGDLATARMIIDEGGNFRGSMEIISSGKPMAAIPETVFSPAEEEPRQTFTASAL